METESNHLNAAYELLERELQQKDIHIRRMERELQVEASLEKVRARTMTMRQSSELNQVVAVVYEQASLLGFSDWGSTIMIFHTEQESIESWVSALSKDVFPTSYLIKGNKHPVIQQHWEVWRNKVPRSSISLKDKEKESYDRYLFAHTDFRHLPEEMKEGNLKEKEVHFSFACMQYGLIAAIDSTAPLSDQNFSILQRIANVFEQTYTRFLDLQKAEAQAREAEIETSLEKIRSASMAMHTSAELPDVALVLVNQLFRLEINQLGSSIFVPSDDQLHYNQYSAHINLEGQEMTLNLVQNIEFPHIFLDREIFRLANSGEKDYSITLRGEELREWMVFTRDNVHRERGEAMLRAGFECIHFHFAIFHGVSSIVITTLTPLPESDRIILRRMADAFGMSYTRFLDLQKAEAQAKEAVRQASLDRVRAEIASMRSAEDLERITPLFWQELTILGVPFFRCGVFIVDEATETVHSYFSTPEGHSLAVMDLPFETSETTSQVVKHWKKNKVFKEHWDRQQFVDWTQSMVAQHRLTNPDEYQDSPTPPESLFLNFVPFKQGMLYIGNSSELSEDEVDLVQSLASAFTIAYARYEDFKQLEEAKTQVEATLDELKSTQTQLIQSEKMASLGELTAGIAHEIQNPLNFVNNYSEVNVELLEELNEEYEKGNPIDVKAIIQDLTDNETKIHYHGKRADAIVRSMMQHSRTNSGTKESTNLNALADEYLRLAYQSFLAKEPELKIELSTDFDEQVPLVEVVPQDIGRVLLNILNNAFQACAERSREQQEDYQPQVKVTTRRVEDTVEVRIQDNGNGIPEAIKDKIFQPFFTTKPTGQGTGLGLSLAYDIVKAHGGELKINSRQNEDTEFIIIIPIK